MYVGNLRPETTEGELRVVFGNCGKVTNVQLKGKDPSQPSRFAFVEFSDPDMVRRAASVCGARAPTPSAMRCEHRRCAAAPDVMAKGRAAVGVYTRAVSVFGVF